MMTYRPTVYLRFETKAGLRRVWRTGGAQSVRQDDPNAPNELLRTVPIGYDCCKSPPAGSPSYICHHPFAHSKHSHVCKPSGILKAFR